eukprot:5274140-Prymnesium_polylepis.2
MAACPLVSSGLLVGCCAVVTIAVARGATSRADPAGEDRAKQRCGCRSPRTPCDAAALQQALMTTMASSTQMRCRQSWSSQRLLPDWLGRCARPFWQRYL